jgi:hypothetical protein
MATVKWSWYSPFFFNHCSSIRRWKGYWGGNTRHKRSVFIFFFLWSQFLLFCWGSCVHKSFFRAIKKYHSSYVVCAEPRSNLVYPVIPGQLNIFLYNNLTLSDTQLTSLSH